MDVGAESNVDSDKGINHVKNGEENEKDKDKDKITCDFAKGNDHVAQNLEDKGESNKMRGEIDKGIGDMKHLDQGKETSSKQKSIPGGQPDEAKPECKGSILPGEVKSHKETEQLNPGASLQEKEKQDYPPGTCRLCGKRALLVHKIPCQSLQEAIRILP